MKFTVSSKAWRPGAAVLAASSLALCGGRPSADSLGIATANWGLVTSAVYGTAQTGLYAGAELFAGPSQFDNDYFHGVLPNGRIVRPSGVSAQIGMNPLGAILTPDGKFLITSNDDERDAQLTSLKSGFNHGGYSISVVDTAAMTVVSQINTAGRLFVGLQVTGSGPYTVWASGGADHDVKLFIVSATGAVSVANPSKISISPILPANAGYVSHYTPGAAFSSTANPPAVPTGFNRAGATRITFPAGMALSPDRRFLYVACNGDNSLAVIDTASLHVVAQVPAGFFPYGVAVSDDGLRVAVSNWGVTEYKFVRPSYDAVGTLRSIEPPNQVNAPHGFYLPITSATGTNPLTSSVSLYRAPFGDGSRVSAVHGVYLGHKLDMLERVGDTHPSAMAIVTRGADQALYVAQANSDSLSIINLRDDSIRPGSLDLAPLTVGSTALPVHGTYPNAIAVAPDRRFVFVAEAGINAVAVLDTSAPLTPRLLGRIPTGWYPTALEVAPDGRTLYIVNAKGVGEDLGGKAPPATAPSLASIDSNYIFGTVQKVDITNLPSTSDRALANNFTVADRLDDRVVPLGGAGSKQITHVVFVLHENKTFDSMLGTLTHLGAYASTQFVNAAGAALVDQQYNAVALNTQLFATRFAVAANYYSDAEESDAGQQFAASGTATDYTEKTLGVKNGRGLLVNKNFEPEDYPEAGYIFNNAARSGISFKDYGALIRIAGSDTGTSTPTRINDPLSGNAGYPASRSPLINTGDVRAATRGMGQTYFMALPVLAVLGSLNASGEPRIDRDYPGYNFNISDQRRALEFITDFDRMVSENRLPQLLYIYQPNDHTGATQAQNVPAPTAAQQVADGDVALGMVVQHIMASPAYYNASTGEGAAVFITYDDAQSTLDHIHPHRTPLVVVSPYAKPGYVGTKHYSTASIVKTEELLLGLPPANLGDLFATDLRDLFEPVYNGIKAGDLPVTRTVRYEPSPEGRRIWALVKSLDTSAPDRDSRRLGALGRLSMAADRARNEAETGRTLGSRAYRTVQNRLYKQAVAVTRLGRRDDD